MRDNQVTDIQKRDTDTNKSLFATFCLHDMSYHHMGDWSASCYHTIG